MPERLHQLKSLRKFPQEESKVSCRRQEEQGRRTSPLKVHRGETGGTLAGMSRIHILGHARYSEWDLGILQTSQ